MRSKTKKNNNTHQSPNGGEVIPKGRWKLVAGFY